MSGHIKHGLGLRPLLNSSSIVPRSFTAGPSQIYSSSPRSISRTTRLVSRELNGLNQQWRISLPTFQRGFCSRNRLQREQIRPVQFVEPKEDWQDKPFEELFPAFQPPQPKVLRPILFAVGLSVASFTTAEYLQNRDVEQLKRQRQRMDPSESQDLRKTRLMLAVEEARAKIAKLQNLHIPIPVIKGYAWFKQQWLNFNDIQRVAWGVIGINSLVFLGWRLSGRVPALQMWMMKNFMHFPTSGRSYTLLTYMFSHHSFWHFGFNMLASYSFMAGIATFLVSRDGTLGHHPERRGTAVSPAYHMVAFLVSAGLLSGLTGHLRAAWRFSRFLRLNRPQAAAMAVRPSLGFSGAAYAMLSLSALTIPDANVQLIFLPGVDIPIGYGVPGLLAMDMLGLLLGWTVLGHDVHLAGAAFGALYFYLFPRS